MKQQNDAKNNKVKIIRNSYLLIEKKLTLALKRKENLSLQRLV